MCEILLKTVMEENDGENCREDMRSHGIHNHLWLCEIRGRLKSHAKCTICTHQMRETIIYGRIEGFMNPYKLF